MDAVTPVAMKPSWALVFLSAIAPLLLLAGLIWWFFHGGSELIDRPVPPIEEISIRRVELKPGEFKLTIRNTGPMPVDMTLVTVDEAIWKAEFSPSRQLERLEEATVRIPFDWVAGDPYKIELFTANGCHSKKRSPSRSRPQGLLRGCSLFSPRWDSMLEFFPWRSASYGCRSYGDSGHAGSTSFSASRLACLFFWALTRYTKVSRLPANFPAYSQALDCWRIGFHARISAHHGHSIDFFAPGPTRRVGSPR